MGIPQHGHWHTNSQLSLQNPLRRLVIFLHWEIAFSPLDLEIVFEISVQICKKPQLNMWMWRLSWFHRTLWTLNLFQSSRTLRTLQIPLSNLNFLLPSLDHLPWKCWILSSPARAHKSTFSSPARAQSTTFSSPIQQLGNKEVAISASWGKCSISKYGVQLQKSPWNILIWRLH
jgi:hypothetical protein